MAKKTAKDQAEPVVDTKSEVVSVVISMTGKNKQQASSFVEKMTSEEQSKLVEAYKAKAAARSVLESIQDRIADDSAKAAKPADSVDGATAGVAAEKQTETVPEQPRDY